MKRRELLAATCTSIAGLAGCSSGDPEQETPATTPIPLSEYECPPHDTNAGAAVCSHTVDTGSASVYLLPSKTTVDASTEVIELRLYNESAAELEFNPYQWSITRKSSSGWEPGRVRLNMDLDETLNYLSEEFDIKRSECVRAVGRSVADLRD